MVHSLYPQAVQIKTTNFEEPAKLVNHLELAAAVGMAYRQAGLAMPEVKVNEGLREFRDRLFPEIEKNPSVNPKLIKAIQNYIFKGAEVIDEDSAITLKLGFEFK